MRVGSGKNYQKSKEWSGMVCRNRMRVGGSRQRRAERTYLRVRLEGRTRVRRRKTREKKRQRRKEGGGRMETEEERGGGRRGRREMEEGG